MSLAEPQELHYYRTGFLAFSQSYTVNERRIVTVSVATHISVQRGVRRRSDGTAQAAKEAGLRVAGAGLEGEEEGFFQNFFDNLKNGIEKNQEIQDSLKGFHEEREKLHQSYVAQQARLKLSAAVERMGELGRRGLEGLKVVKDSSSKVN